MTVAVRRERLQGLADLIASKFALIKEALPRYLVPRYFDEVWRRLSVRGRQSE